MKFLQWQRVTKELQIRFVMRHRENLLFSPLIQFATMNSLTFLLNLILTLRICRNSHSYQIMEDAWSSIKQTFHTALLPRNPFAIQKESCSTILRCTPLTKSDLFKDRVLCFSYAEGRITLGQRATWLPPLKRSCKMQIMGSSG